MNAVMSHTGKKPRPAHLSKAPIVEALVDIHVAPSLDLSSVLSRLEPLVRAEFPNRKTLYVGEARFSWTDTEAEIESAKPMVRGYAYWSADGKRVLQVRAEGFSYSRLAPYGTWEQLKQEAEMWFTRLFESCGISSIERYAVRYINRMKLPLPIHNFSDYLRTSPEVSTDLPQGLSSFFFQLTMPFPDQVLAVVNMATEAAADNDTLPLIFDIDVFRRGTIEPKTLWERMEALRNVKNDIFFDSLTQQAWRLFE
jgi:uncharacterized protein (TIGR04255 family)